MMKSVMGNGEPDVTSATMKLPNFIGGRTRPRGYDMASLGTDGTCGIAQAGEGNALLRLALRKRP